MLYFPVTVTLPLFTEIANISVIPAALNGSTNFTGSFMLNDGGNVKNSLVFAKPEVPVCNGSLVFNNITNTTKDIIVYWLSPQIIMHQTSCVHFM